MPAEKVQPYSEAAPIVETGDRAMPGLLARARLVRQRSGEGEKGEEGPAFDDSGVSAEKKQEILAQIERIVARERSPVPAGAFRVLARKQGILLPLVANAVVALLTVAVILVAARYFRVRQERLSGESASYLSTEGRLVDAIRRESEQKLQQKDAEIAGIQEQLTLLDQESEKLRATMDDRVREREARLRQEMQALVDAERKKLESQGVGAAEVERRLAQVSEQKSREQAQDLERYRAALEEESQAREAAIQGEREKALDSLKKADLERVLLVEAQKGAEEARAGFDAERQGLRDQVSGVERKLRDLEETQRREQAVTDQILGYYTRVIEEISRERYEEARADLTRFRRFLADPTFDALPAVARRREVDLFLIAALQAIVAPEYFDAFRSRELLATIEKQVKDAEAKAQAGDLAEAKRLYGEAVGMVGSVELAVAALRSIDSGEREAILRESVARSSSAAANGDLSAMTEELRRMLDVLPSPDRALFADALSALEVAFADRESTALAEKDARNAREQGELERRIGSLVVDVASRQAAADAAQADALSAREAAAKAAAKGEPTLAEAEASSGALAARLEELTRIAATGTAASSAYQAGAGEARRLLQGERPDPQSAEAVLEQAMGTEAASTIFPGLHDLLGQLSLSLQSTAQRAGYAAGYQAAAEDVVDYTSYVGGAASEATESARARLLSRVESDPAFRSAVGGIDGLVGKVETAPPLIRSASRFLGPVASVEPGRVVVEALGRGAVESGSRVELRRSTASGKDEVVARGAVESVQGQRVLVRLESSAPGSTASVRLSDAAYVVTQ